MRSRSRPGSASDSKRARLGNQSVSPSPSPSGESDAPKSSPHLDLASKTYFLRSFPPLPEHCKVVRLSPAQCSRLLYPNPVCLLSTSILHRPELAKGISTKATLRALDKKAHNNSAKKKLNNFALNNPEMALRPDAPRTHTGDLNKNPFALLEMGDEEQDQEHKTHEDAQDEQEQHAEPALTSASAPVPLPLSTTLSSVSPSELSASHLPLRNVQVLSWITPTNNNGNFIFSLNKCRYSSQLLRLSHRFVLNIPTENLQSLCLQVGGVSAVELGGLDKFSHFNISTCVPGWRHRQDIDEFYCETESTSSSDEVFVRKFGRPTAPLSMENARLLDDVAISACCAHLVCELECLVGDNSLDAQHDLLYCRVVDGFVRADYLEGGIFHPVDPSLPKFLTFLGGGKFGAVTRTKTQ